MANEVRHNEGASRYELHADGMIVGIADYTMDGETMVFPHTEIDPARRGQGLGEILVRAALDDVRITGRRVVPACWFVADFIKANPDYEDLLAS